MVMVGALSSVYEVPAVGDWLTTLPSIDENFVQVEANASLE